MVVVAHHHHLPPVFILWEVWQVQRNIETDVRHYIQRHSQNPQVAECGMHPQPDAL